MLVDDLVFLQGDDASRVFDIMYPAGNAYGSDRTLRQALNEMLSMTSDDHTVTIKELETYGASGQFRTKYHILIWSYAYNWIALYRKVTKKEARVRELVAI